MKGLPYFPTFRFIQQSGAEGRRWVAEYERHSEPARVAQGATPLVLRRALEEAAPVLERAAALLALNNEVDPGVRGIVARYVLSAAALYAYVRGEYEEADRLMTRSEREVLAALLHDRHLLVLFALDCWEIRLQRARIARERRAWTRMRAHLARAAAMRTGAVPLCTLADGTRLWLADVQRFCRSVSCSEPEEREMLRVVADERENGLRAEAGSRYVLRFPGFVTPYPAA